MKAAAEAEAAAEAVAAAERRRLNGHRLAVHVDLALAVTTLHARPGSTGEIQR